MVFRDAADGNNRRGDNAVHKYAILEIVRLISRKLKNNQIIEFEMKLDAHKTKEKNS